VTRHVYSTQCELSLRELNVVVSQSEQMPYVSPYVEHGREQLAGGGVVGSSVGGISARRQEHVRCRLGPTAWSTRARPTRARAPAARRASAARASAAAPLKD